jgi:hypothetical protein
MIDFDHKIKKSGSHLVGWYYYAKMVLSIYYSKILKKKFTLYHIIFPAINK